MKCLLKYQWVKLPRSVMPQGKGIMGYWAKLASRAAFRNGKAKYYRYINRVAAGSWVGGIVGLKSILGIKNKTQAIQIMDTLKNLGYLTYHLDPCTKKLTYSINDWVTLCTGEACSTESIYSTQGYGFLCLPRSITASLVSQAYIFDDADAWLDLWCHTIYQDRGNVFSSYAPIVQFGKYGAVLTLEKLGCRWHWEKTKVWRFFKKYSDTFHLHKLPGSYGCLVFNKRYLADIQQPGQRQIERILEKIRIMGRNTHIFGTDHQRISKMVSWYSLRISTQVDSGNRVALSPPYIYRAYFSLWICKNCNNDCKSIAISKQKYRTEPRGPCMGLLNLEGS